MERVVVFRTVVYDRVAETLRQARSRFAEAHLAFAGSELDWSRLAPDARGSVEFLPFAGARYGLGANGRALAARLRQGKFDTAIIPVRSPSVRAAVADYANVLALAFIGGVRTVILRTPDGTFHTCTVPRVLGSLALTLLGLCLMPLWLARAIVQVALAKNPRDDAIISFSGEPNDWLCHLAKANWARTTGFFGVSYNCYLGNPYSVTYPPLSIAMLSVLSVKGMTLCILLGFLATFALFSSLVGPLALVLGAYLLGSPILQSAVIRIGRPEALGWLFGLVGVWGTMAGHAPVSALALLLALLTHQFSGAFSWLLIITTILSVRGLDLYALGLCAVASSVALGWWVPFLRHGKNLGFWRFREAVPEFGLRREDVWPPLVVWTAFSSTAFVLLPAQRALFIPFLCAAALAAVMLARRRYFAHPFSVELALLLTSAVPVLLGPTWLTTALLIVSAFVCATYGSRSGYAIRPYRAGAAPSEALGLLSPLPEGSRVAWEFREGWNVETDWAWWLGYATSTQSRVELLHGVAMDQVPACLPLEFECKIHTSEGVPSLLERLRRVQASHVAVFSDDGKQSLLSAAWPLSHEGCVVGPSGRPKRSYAVFAVPEDKSRLLPIERGRNRLTIHAGGAATVTVPYAYCSAWAAHSEDGRRLTIEDVDPGMLVHAGGAKVVRLTFNLFR